MSQNEEQEVSLKGLFIPFTNLKAIHWIIFIGIIVFVNTFFNGFVWDDVIYILYNPQIHSINLATVLGKSFFNIGGQYRPIPAFYYSFLYSFFSDSPFFYHIFSISIHICNSVLVYLLFNKFFKNYLSFFLSLIFLVHPMQVESATFISTAGNNLYFSFGLIALLLSFVEKISLKRGIVIISLLVLSLLSKETGFLFLFMIFAARFFFQNKNFITFFYLGISTVVIYAILRFGVGHIYFDKQQLGFVPIYNLSFEQRLLNIPAIVFYYFSTFFLPIKLAIMQYWVVEKIRFGNFYLPLFWDLLFFSILILCMYIFKKARTIFIFFFIWLSIGLLLHIQIFPLTMTVADRWFYFAMVGLLGILGVILQFLINKYKHSHTLLLVLGIVVVLLLSVRTMVRNTNWTDNLTLFSHDSKINENFIIESNLATIYRSEQNIPEAISHYERSVKLHPYDVNLYNLGLINEAVGNKQVARDYFFRILELKDRNDNSYNQKMVASAWILLQKDDISITKAFTQKALAKNPDNAYLWAVLAVGDYKLGNKDSAIKNAEKAKELSNDQRINNLYYLIVEDKPIPENINIVPL